MGENAFLNQLLKAWLYLARKPKKILKFEEVILKNIKKKIE